MTIRLQLDLTEKQMREMSVEDLERHIEGCRGRYERQVEVEQARTKREILAEFFGVPAETQEEEAWDASRRLAIALDHIVTDKQGA